MSRAKSKEDSIVGVGKVDGVIQSDLVQHVILAVATFPIEPPVFEGMNVCVVLGGTWDKVMNGMSGVRIFTYL